MAYTQYNFGQYREQAVLKKLQSELPNGYDLFHGLTWQTMLNAYAQHGELDIVVLAPTGVLFLLEIKGGAAKISNGKLYKTYQQSEKDITNQSNIQYGAMMQKLKQANLYASVVNALVLPDCQLLNKSSLLAFDAERIIDASNYNNLASQLVNWANHLTFKTLGSEKQSNREALKRFLSNEFLVISDTQALSHDLRQASYQIAGGLASWIPRMSVPSGQIRIQATAGSGKTQLALRLLDQAASQQQRALYVCYNRVLADAMRQHSSPKIEVVTFHELAIDYYGKQHDIDFNNPQVFDQAAQIYVQNAEQFPAKLDLLIIDEGQDFEPEWVSALVPMLKQDGRLYLLEDEAQKLYPRGEFDLPDATLVRCQDNYRSPRMVCQAINAMGLSPLTINPHSPYDGDVPATYTYDTDAQMHRKTKQAISDMLEQGIALNDIVVLSYKGKNHSKLFQEAQNSGRIGQWQANYATNQYDPAGDIIRHQGEITLETLYRFKGQSTVAVIISEIDFDQLNDTEKRKLFVGMTRGMLKVALVMSEKVETELSRQLA